MKEERMSIECSHGQLARSCERCADECTINSLHAQLAECQRERDETNIGWQRTYDHDVSLLKARAEKAEAELAECQQQLEAEQDEVALKSACIEGMDAAAKKLYSELVRVTAEKDAAQANYQFMVSRAADEKLDGYRELGQRVADAEAKRDAAVARADDLEIRKDAAYLERNRLVALAAKMAIAMGYTAGIARTAIEGWSEDWHGCVYIDLPTGQASWHYHDTHAFLFRELPAYAGSWDGHSTPEKYDRVALYLDQNARADRLEAAIMDAPHNEWCRLSEGERTSECDCWKREALEGK